MTQDWLNDGDRRVYEALADMDNKPDVPDSHPETWLGGALLMVAFCAGLLLGLVL